MMDIRSIRILETFSNPEGLVEAWEISDEHDLLIGDFNAWSGGITVSSDTSNL
jgi:hypothetical protein